MDNLEKNLKKFKKIEPDKIFKKRSRAIILNSPQIICHNNFQAILDLITPKVLMISSVTASMALLIGALSILGNHLLNPSLAKNFDKTNINKEIEEFNFQFAQIDYYRDSAKKIEVALKKTSDTPLSEEELSL